MSAPAPDFVPGLAWTMPVRGRCLIEASAGTGKTYTIADLVLRLLLGDCLKAGRAPVRIEQILIVTFTKAATAELQDRIRRRVADAVRMLGRSEAPGDEEADAAFWTWLRNELPDPEPRRLALSRLRRALADIDLAAVSTIHGFCQTILRERAAQTGSDPAAEVSGDDRPRLEILAHDFWLRHVASPGADAQVAEAGEAAGFGKKLVDRLIQLGEVALRQPHGARLRLQAPEPDADDVGRRMPETFVKYLEELTGGHFDSGHGEFVFDGDGGRWDAERRRSGTLTFGDLQRDLDRALATETGLARELRRRFPVALVDEFQDTDPVQWAIFDRIWPARETNDSGADGALLALIGDPKQAIYRFRGGDIHTYLAARATVAEDHRLTLRQNFRSDETLLDGLNRWLGRVEHAGCYGREASGDGISWVPVKARYGRRLQPETHPSILLDWALPGVKVGDVPAVVVQWVRELVGDGDLRLPDNGGDASGRPVGYGDIAVLVPANAKGLDVHRALTRAGIPAALQTRSSVLQTPEARELLVCLHAILTPGDSGRVRRALASRLFGMTAADLRGMLADDDAPAAPDAWLRCVTAFDELRRLWLRFGTGAMFGRLLDDPGLLAACGCPAPGGESLRSLVLAWPDGMRAATDLQHLAELLTEQARQGQRTPAGLVRWFEQRIEGAAEETVAADELQLRLDRDRDAVRILSVHASKGLQFPIVLLPYLAASQQAPSADRAFPWVHPLAAEGGHRARSGVWLSEKTPRNKDNGKKKNEVPPKEDKVAEALTTEREAEEHRLFYVAITRAQFHLRMFWYLANGDEDRALGQRILKTTGYKGFRGKYLDPPKKPAKEADPIQIRAVFNRFREQVEDAEDVPPRAWTVREWQAAAPPAGSGPAAGASGAEHADAWTDAEVFRDLPSRVAGADWRIHSYTSLKRGGAPRGPGESFGAEGADVDDPDLPWRTGARITGGWPPGFAGVRAGQVVHDLLESAFGPDIGGGPARLGGPALRRALASGDEAALPAIRAMLARHGYRDAEAEIVPALRRSLQALLTTPISTGDTALRLDRLAPEAVVAEQAFWAPLAGTGEGFRLGQLAAALTDASPATEVDRRLAELAAAGLPDSGDRRPLEGLLTGIIDLAFEHDGRLWLADWKTNQLPEGRPLDETMAAQGFGLQALLYALAARRWLLWRGRDPAADFGGVLYLFVRAFTADDPVASLARGAVVLQPSGAWLAEVDRLLLAPTPEGT